MSPSGSVAVPSRVTVPPPATLAGSAVAETSGGWFPRTVIGTSALAFAPSAKTVRDNVTIVSLTPASKAVHTGSAMDALLNVPRPDVDQL